MYRCYYVGQDFVYECKMYIKTNKLIYFMTKYIKNNDASSLPVYYSYCIIDDSFHSFPKCDETLGNDAACLRRGLEFTCGR